MATHIKQFVISLCIISMLLSGCSSDSNRMGDADGQQQAVSAQKFDLPSPELRTYIDLYGSQLLYMDINEEASDFYIYDLSDQTTKKINSIENFALKGKSNALLNDILYFYVSVYKGDNLENCLYAVDFEKGSMEKVSKNDYAQKLIPLTVMGDHLLALQGDRNQETEDVQTFIEGFKIDTSLAERKLEKTTFANESGDKYLQRHMLYFDSDDEFLYVIEKDFTEEPAKYYLTKYNQTNTRVGEIPLNRLFADNPITDNIGLFFGFDDYFCITDFSGNTLIGKIEGKNSRVIFCGADIEYVVNGVDSQYEYFYQRQTNKIYLLNKKTGEFSLQTYNLDNEASVIRCILSYGDKLLIVKDETIYFTEKAKN